MSEDFAGKLFDTQLETCKMMSAEIDLQRRKIRELEKVIREHPATCEELLDRVTLLEMRLKSATSKEPS